MKRIIIICKHVFMIICLWSLINCYPESKIRIKHIENKFMSFDIPETWTYKYLTDSNSTIYPIFIAYDSLKKPEDNIFMSSNIFTNISNFDNFINQELKSLKSDPKFVFIEEKSELKKSKLSHKIIIASTFDKVLNQERQLHWYYFYKENNVYVILFSFEKKNKKVFQKTINDIISSVNLKSFHLFSAK